MGAITIGPGATNRASASNLVKTRIDPASPASSTGSLDTFEIWANSSMTGAKIGTFSGSGTSWTNRDYESIGNVTSGSKQTFTGLSCSVVAGDVIGAYWASGDIEMDNSGGTVVYKDGDQFGAGLQTGYTEDASKTYSLYGSGLEGPGLLKAVNRLAKTSVKTINTLGIAAVSSLKGL